MDYSKIIRDFVSGCGGEWDWDDFISTPGENYSVELLKKFCSDVQLIYPSSSKTCYCSDLGVQKLLEASAMYEISPEVFVEWLNRNFSDWVKCFERN